MTKKNSFLLICTAGVFILLLNSSFKSRKDEKAACNGPFYTGNPFGAAFSILGPGGAGAPDEPGTCGRSSCHNTTDNTGPGTFSFEINDGVTEYIPGETYTFTVTIDQSGINAFDFEITNRPKSGGTNAAGSFIITDPARTKKTSGSFGGAGNNYVEGTACGIDALRPGHNQWSFNWEAPATAIGDITFYLGVVAANFNNTPGGDFTYSKTMVLKPKPENKVGIARQILALGDVKLYPNPAVGSVNLDYTLRKESLVTIKITDLKGALVETVLSEKEPAGEYRRSFDTNHKNYRPGIYFVGLSIDHLTVSTHKLIVE